MQATLIPRALAFALTFGLCLGCGGGGGTDALGMSWSDDGTAVKPLGAKATLNSTGGSDSYEIAGLGADPANVVIAVTAPSPIAPQTFVCNQTTAGHSVGVTYSPTNGGIEIADQSCTVVLTKTGQVGGTVAGTFQAVINLQAGGTKTISNGTFDLLVSM